jgi:hypothetical protein
MIVVIQCAASKRPDAGHFLTASGKLVDFVAQPQIAPRDSDQNRSSLIEATMFGNANG